jgi:hypothetical protein
VKRLLLYFVLVACVAVPTTARAWPAFAVFTFNSDPLDPIRATNTGWFSVPQSVSIRYDMIWNSYAGMDFWWQGQHWTSSNSMMSFFGLAAPIYNDVGGWRLDGGQENLFGNWLFGESPLGNNLDHPFDFTMSSGSTISDKGGGGGGPYVLGETYTCTMWYVNPTASHHAANGSYYIATGTFYLTNDLPAPSQEPGVPEPSSLALIAVGVGAIIVGRRFTSG